MKIINGNIGDGKSRLGLLSTLVSIGIHLAVFIILLLLFNFFEQISVLPGYYIEVADIKGNLNSQVNKIPDETHNKLPNLTDPNEKSGKEVQSAPDKSVVKEIISTKKENTLSKEYGNLRTAGFDSTTLNQVYKEPTLNVRLKYPLGWVYMDQQRKNKLDGITFWAATGNFNPPPYIHVEVVDKDLFIPDQYKYKYDFKDFEGYYNDPVEMENQVSQSIYLRTDDDEDFVIKLIMTGKDQFDKFQPIFFSMVNSFRFGKSFF